MIEYIWKGRGFPDSCAIGGHPFGVTGRAAFYVDGHAICTEHALEIANGIDNRPRGETVDSEILDVMRRQRAKEREDARQAAADRLRGKRQPGFVYYIRMNDLIKIGYAADITKRMRAYPPNAELLAAHPGTMELEHEMHNNFRSHLRRGREWFAEHPALMEHIASVRERFGDVSALAHEYRSTG